MQMRNAFGPDWPDIYGINEELIEGSGNPNSRFRWLITNPDPFDLTPGRQLMPDLELPTMESSPATEFSSAEVDAFHRDGYVIVRGLADSATVETMRRVTRDGVERGIGPIEFEADVAYPGAPQSRVASGGDTVRRLKQAIGRDPMFIDWLSAPPLITRLGQIFEQQVVMPLAHHNCIMTKQPRFSSETGWHQDIRYWSFERPELVSVWLALGEENPENGCLRLIPGSHQSGFDRGRLDDALFLRPDRPENTALIAQQVNAVLYPGDALFFHCRTFHSANRNTTDTPKYSAVFTFRPADNPPVPGTRSASLPELVFP